MWNKSVKEFFLCRDHNREMKSHCLWVLLLREVKVGESMGRRKLSGQGQIATVTGHSTACTKSDNLLAPVL
jgi:hypothetical protein